MIEPQQNQKQNTRARTRQEFDVAELDHLTPYIMSEDELGIFIKILLKDKHSPYTAFIIVLLKELGYDITKFLRVINVGFKTKGIIRKSLLEKVLATIREVTIIKDLEFRDSLSKYTISEMARSLRYRERGITRWLIYYTIDKHGLKVLDRDRRV